QDSITCYEDTTNPTAGTLSVDESSSYLHVNGANFYYSEAMGATEQTASFSVADPSDGGAGLQYITFPAFFGESAVNDSEASYTEDYLINNTDTTTGAFTCTTVDNVGNSSTTNTITVTKDTTNPSIDTTTLTETSSYLYYDNTDLYYSDGMGSTPQDADFNGTSSDGGAGLSQATFSTAFGDSPSADDTPASWSAAYTIVDSDTGTQTLTVTVTDNVGNQSQDSITCYEDTTNPTAGTLSVDESSSYLHVNGANFYYSEAMGAADQTASFSVAGASDGGAGLQYITFPEFFGESAVNDSETSYTEDYLINNTDTTTGAFICTAVDSVGNSSTTNTITVAKDTTDPTATSVACYADTLGDDAAYDDDITVGLQWSESDGTGAGILSVNACIGTTPPDEAVSVGTESDTDTGTEGSNTYYVQLTDNVGNTSSIGSDTITIDLSDPDAPGNLTFNSKTSDSVILNFGAQSTEPNFDTYKIFYKQGTSGVTESDTEHVDSDLGYINYNTTTNTTISSLTTDNYYTFNIWVYDLVGKKASATEITVFVGDCTITSAAIDYDDGVGAIGWGEISWTDTETNGSIIYQVEYWNVDAWALVPDNDLTNNSSGFGASPIDISGLNTTTHNQIRIKATFTYSDGTPVLSDWTCTWSTNQSPTEPTLPWCEDTVNPPNVSDLMPEFSAVYNDPDSGDTTNACYILVASSTANLDAGTGDLWDSGWLVDTTSQGERSSDKTYVGTAFSNNTTYYWKIRFRDDDNEVGTWSANQQFTTCAANADVVETSSRTTSTWYQGDGFTFEFSSANLDNTAIQYYKYVWDTSATTDASSGTTWSSSDITVPNGTYTKRNKKGLYLHVLSYNSQDQAAPQGTQHYGPYWCVETSRLLKGGKFFDDDGNKVELGPKE
ncbi:MAG: hypothetical protein KJ952_00840, partial [Candidatus Omnitrophica bacterium]|nr:hypothetical protein [Candidatus Omnitrophota bacterium]